MSTAYLSIENVDKSFTRDKVTNHALDTVNLKVNRGEYISIIGHSGCGKSTLLNIVAGLTDATQGCVILDGKEVNSPGPDRAVVFQNHSLLPWLTVYENVALAVNKVFKRSKTKAERHACVLRNLELVGMSHALHRRPSAQIGEILDIDLPRPRNRIALAEDLKYNHYRREILRFLHEKQRKVASLNPKAASGSAPALAKSSAVAEH